MLDEPETHLDVEGEKALLDAVEKLKATYRATLVVVTRHIKLIQMMDKTLLLREGKAQAFGKTAEVLKAMGA